mgnify:CR=1 FL=1
MKSDLPKVLHQLNGKPLIEYVVETAKQSGADEVVAIVGHKRELVMEQLAGSVKFAVQAEQLGTGHAVQQAEPMLRDSEGETLILSGDVPLLRAGTIRDLRELHHQQGNSCTLVSCIFQDPTGYGRVVRSNAGSVLAIVEHKDATPEIREIKEINSGIYLVNTGLLFEALNDVKNDNAQGEYYLTDIVGWMVERGYRVGGLVVEDELEIAGVNSREELQRLESEYLNRNTGPSN